MKTALFTLFMALVLTYSSVNAQEHKEFTKSEVNNLIEALRSDNDGVRMQAIYLAGKYEVPETVGELKKALKNASTSNEKILVSLSLYRIGDFNGMNAVRTAALSDSSTKVRNRCAVLYNDYIKSTVVFVK